MEPKKMYRSRKNRIIAGVCGGFGEYCNIDPTLVRIIAVVSGVGLLAYLICMIIIPEEV